VGGSMGLEAAVIEADEGGVALNRDPLA
jgi:hypothetical protein